MTLDPLAQNGDEQLDVRLQPDALAGFHQMLPAHAAEFRIVQNQVRELASLLHEPRARHPRDLFLEAGQSQHFAEGDAGIIETQCLIEVARQHEMSRSIRLVFHNQPFVVHHYGVTTTPERVGRRTTEVD